MRPGSNDPAGSTSHRSRVWLAKTPPLPEFDLHSITSEDIALGCNEESVILFNSVLDFTYFLAVLGFTVAFVAET